MNGVATETSAVVARTREQVTWSSRQASSGSMPPSTKARRAPRRRSSALAAEFDNYRKRAARDQEHLGRARGTSGSCRSSLPVLDDLERALAAAEQHEEAQLEEGVQLVHRSLAHAARGSEGRRRRSRPTAMFDPHVHEALLSQPSDARRAPCIEVLQKGYRLGDRVLRPRAWWSPRPTGGRVAS